TLLQHRERVDPLRLVVVVGVLGAVGVAALVEARRVGECGRRGGGDVARGGQRGARARVSRRDRAVLELAVVWAVGGEVEEERPARAGIDEGGRGSRQHVGGV